MTRRVLHVIDSLVPRAGSPAITLPGLLSALQRAGWSSESLTGETGAGLDHPVHLYPTESLPRALPELFKGFDLLHLHGWRSDLPRAAARAAIAAHKPFVVSPLGTSRGPLLSGEGRWREWWNRQTDRKLLAGAAAVTALNQAEADELREARVPDPIVLPYGLNFEDYAAPQNNVDSTDNCAKPMLLVLGPVEPTEGCVALLKALAELGPIADGWSVIFAGPQPGAWRPMLEAAVRRKGGSGRVRFEDAEDLAAQKSLLARASLVVVPALRVRTAEVILQAAACGVPVVASRLVVPDQLRDAIKACEPTRDALRQALREMMSADHATRRAWGEKRREAARAALDWDVLVDAFIRLYESAFRMGSVTPGAARAPREQEALAR